MDQTQCPFCGKPAHSLDSEFDCAGRPDGESGEVGAAPVHPMPQAGSTLSSENSFRLSDPGMGTKLTYGTRVGEYVIQELVGEGGMGRVYSAHHPIIGKKVAVKILSASLAKNKVAIQRFMLEARAVNDIEHPGLVDIFSFGRLTDGRHYFVMEFLEGRNLGDLLRERGRLPMVEVVPMFLEIGRTLTAVHSKGIVHRDLKPENIFQLKPKADGKRHIKLLDFGLAKLVEGASPNVEALGPHTAAGVSVGTPFYMSPEQCRGDKIDTRSDLYAFGILLYEILTGVLPISGPTTLDIWQAHVERVPRPAHEVAPHQVTLALSAVINKLLAKRPSDRYQDAGSVCLALASLPESGEPGAPPPLSPTSGKNSILRDLSEALEGTPSNYNLVALDEAIRETAAGAAEPGAGMVNLDELAKTSDDLAAIMLPEEGMTEEDQQREIENVRAKLGVRIDTPVRDEAGAAENSQMSALEIHLDLPPLPRSEEGAATEVSSASKLPRIPARPIVEIAHVAPPTVSPALTRAPAIQKVPFWTTQTGQVVKVVTYLVLLGAVMAATWLFIH